MTLDEWLDEPQTVTTRRERAMVFVSYRDNKYTRRMMLDWIKAAWDAGAENAISQGEKE